jgi:uncharacterized protein Yka (UPF0111/DUF47 family)
MFSLRQFSLIPRETRFFDMFNEATARITAAADRFVDLIATFDNLPERARAMKVEEEGVDGIIGNTLEALDRSFITPFDREDIHALVVSLDDVMDKMEETAHRFAVARIDRPTPAALELSRIVQEACHHLEQGIQKLRDMRNSEQIKTHVRAISRLENQADQVYRQADADLYANDSGDVLHLFKWHELYTWLEETVDATKQVSHVISGILVKGA